ncbi:MAG: type II toxin-antitoxin system RelE/ParE family toxin [bacterium]|nr:type II toxin-antitoxin system RelE/ParE family toxin [bacterium]
MQVVYLKKFFKDLDKLKKPKDRQHILVVIEQVKSAESLVEISRLKKLVVYSDAYRTRKGDWRIGVFVVVNTVEFARVAHRKDIYNIFP